MSEKIVAYQGKLFTVSLESHFGSTNIGWCLTSLPKGIALLAEEIEKPHTSRPGASVQQVFSFSALDVVKEAKLEFRLIKHAAAIRKEEQLKTVEIAVEIVPYDTNSGVSKDWFVEYSENAATYSSAQDDDCIHVLKYGYPPYMKYGYPAASAGGAAPCPPVTGSDGTIRYLYGYLPMVAYGYPGAVLKYGYPPEGAKADCEIVQDDCGCYIAKYGYPVVVDYGYPGCQG